MILKPNDWRPVCGHEGYYVNRAGDVYSKKSGRILKQSWGGSRRCQYKQVRIWPTTKRVHTLVAEAWIGPKMENFEVCHKDDDRSNNSVENLYYGTPQDNATDRVKNGRQARGSRQGKSKLTEDQVSSILSDTRKQTIIAEHYGVSRATVSMIKSRQIWQHVSEKR